MGADGDEMGETLSAKERIKRSGPTTKTHRVWLGADLDLIDEYEATQRELEDARKPADSLAGNGSTGDIQARLDNLRARLDEYAMDFRLRGLDDGAYQRLREEHPARKVDGELHPDDRGGWNSTSFPAALVRSATVAPVLDDEDWAVLFGEPGIPGVLSSVQQDELAAVAFTLSRKSVDIPF